MTRYIEKNKRFRYVEYSEITEEEEEEVDVEGEGGQRAEETLQKEFGEPANFKSAVKPLSYPWSPNLFP